MAGYGYNYQPNVRPQDGDRLDPRVWTQLPPARESRYYRFIADHRRISDRRMRLVGGQQYRHSLGTGRGFAIEIPVWINRPTFLHWFGQPALAEQLGDSTGPGQPATQPILDRPVTPRPNADGVTLRSRTLPQTVYDTGNPYLFPAGGDGQIPVEAETLSCHQLSS